MLESREILSRMYDHAAVFKGCMARKDYLRAALCADSASEVALFISLDEKYRKEIFGDRQADEPVPGLIDEEQYLKACEWCIMHGYEKSRSTLENIMKYG